MLSKTACLSRALLTRSLPHIQSNIKLSTLSKNFKILQPTSCHSSAKFHTGFYLLNSNETQKIISSQQNKSVLSDDLKNILNKKYGEDEEGEAGKKQQQQQQEQTNQDPNNDSKDDQKSKFSTLFSREHAWKVSLTFFTALFGGSFIYVLVNWGSPKLDENKNPLIDEFSKLPIFWQYPRRAFRSVMESYQAIKDPSTDKLLPEPIQPPYYQPPYTLVIEMSGVLLHPEWTFATGWRYKKRPGMDYFIEQVKYPTFEVVLFTREPFLSGAPIAASLDPQQNIHFKLFRESTKFIDNNYVKDLSYMNRDLSKIIVIDCDDKAYQLQPRNALHRLKKWEGDESDTDLVHLASFLKMIATSGVADVREVLDYYNKEIDPLDTFKMNQVRLAEAEVERKQKEAELGTKKTGFSLFRR